MKKDRSTIILVVIFFAGLSLLLYPTVANWWNEQHASTAIADYVGTVASADRTALDEALAEAEAYNRRVAQRGNVFSMLSEEETALYNRLLNVEQLPKQAMMGYLTISRINISLPIYHGTEEEVLSVGVGHLAGSGLPIGGTDTHTVLSGHRGLPSAKLFSDLDKLVTGDTFTLEVLGRTTTYEVDQILIVLPEDVSALQIEPDADLCTLITCTPYGVNTHRLLVRGHRVRNQQGTSEVRVVADAFQIETIYVATALAVPVLLLLLLALLVDGAAQKKKREKARRAQ